MSLHVERQTWEAPPEPHTLHSAVPILVSCFRLLFARFYRGPGSERSHKEVDQFAGNVHALEQYKNAAGRVADDLLGIARKR